ncbi:MAG: hypothetical protein IJP42_11095, partial [Selenomonadaceae bacterium]|nr:hypothetical protein [Selenomonadaceae bacterium]
PNRLELPNQSLHVPIAQRPVLLAVLKLPNRLELPNQSLHVPIAQRPLLLAVLKHELGVLGTANLPFV